MPACAHCGSRNAEGLRFCQDCGQKLSTPAASGPRSSPPETPRDPPRAEDRRAGIPDTGVRPSAPVLGPVVACPRCHVDNRPGMNFCKMCGASLPRSPEEPSAAPRDHTVQTPLAAPPLPAPSSGGRGAMVQAFPMGPICGRCRGANSPSAEFCRFCGTPLAPTDADRPPAIPLPLDTADTGRDTLVQKKPADPDSIRIAMPTIASSPSPVPPAPAARAAVGGEPGLASMTVETGIRTALVAVAPPVTPAVEPVLVSSSASISAPRLSTSTQALGATAGTSLAQITTILRDGSAGATYPVTSEQTDIGREEGHILLADDPYICPRHARLLRRDGRFYLRDLASVNGIFVRVTATTELRHRDAVLVGQQLLILELLEEAEAGLGPAIQHGTLVFGAPELPRVARLALWTTEGVARDVHTLHRPETILGREVGDIVFPEDTFMSRRHAAIRCDPATRRFSLDDLDSSNGTFVRFRGERELRFGDRFRLGQHLFRFDPVGVS